MAVLVLSVHYPLPAKKKTAQLYQPAHSAKTKRIKKGEKNHVRIYQNIYRQRLYYLHAQQ